MKYIWKVLNSPVEEKYNHFFSLAMHCATEDTYVHSRLQVCPGVSQIIRISFVFLQGIKILENAKLLREK